VKFIGKNALITGSANRIGKEIAIYLASIGINVALHYNKSSDSAINTLEEIKKHKINSSMFQADLSKEKNCLNLIKNVNKTFGPISILINNASTFKKNNLHNTKIVDLNNDFFVNLIAPLILSREIFKGNLKGKVVNLTDWKTIRKNRFSYGLSKFAISGLTKSLAISMAPRFQVNEIALGAILPPVDAQSRRTKNINLGPMKRVGRIDEIISCIRMFLDNDFITGEKINIDGGRHIL